MEKEANCTLDVNVVPACFDANKFEPTEGHIENRILTVARHVEKKGIEYALRSIANIDTKVDYRVIGTGPRTEYLKELTEDLKIKDQVSFLGRVSDERLKREMDEAQLFLLPCVVAKNGDRDGVPVSIKEAMAMKTPPVTTTVSGIPEIVDESCGYLSPPKDVESLCNSIKEGLNSRSNDIGRNAQQRIQSHKSEKVVDDLIKIFHELV
ncbi:glycosyltransferase [Halogeometricum borinquense DSM 11551]|nr:glycosyltransferase [Halogeometricum borinquense DSM 11551]